MNSMQKLTIGLCISLLVILLPGASLAQAAEIVPETGTISYTGQDSLTIELTDVNAGTDGKIYITDKSNAVANVLNPPSGEYKVYNLAISGDTGDVQLAPDGRIWYTDNVELLGMFNPAACDTYLESCQGIVWRFPELGSELDKINIGPFTFDDQGRVWVGDFAGTIPMLYRATQTSSTNLEYCPYDIGFYHTHDLKFHDGAVWFGDYAAHRVLRFDSTTEILSYWQLPFDADPDGMTFDASGGLWWVEIDRGRIGHLTFGVTDTLSYYEIPGTAQPIGISMQTGKIWYSDKNGKVGELDPGTAIPTSSATSLEISLNEKNASCKNFTPYMTISAYYMETKTLTFTDFDPPLTPDTSHVGWTIFTLPAGSKPTGIAAVGGAVYVADSDTSTQGVGKLMRFTLPQDHYNVYLPLILR